MDINVNAQDDIWTYCLYLNWANVKINKTSNASIGLSLIMFVLFFKTVVVENKQRFPWTTNPVVATI